MTLGFRLLAVPHGFLLGPAGPCFARSLGLLLPLRLLACYRPLPLRGPAPLDLLLLAEGRGALPFGIAFSRRLAHASFLASSLVVTHPLGLPTFGVRAFAPDTGSFSLLDRLALPFRVLPDLLLSSFAIRTCALVTQVLRLPTLSVRAVALAAGSFLDRLTLPLRLLPQLLLGSLTILTGTLVVLSVEVALVEKSALMRRSVDPDSIALHTNRTDR